MEVQSNGLLYLQIAGSMEHRIRKQVLQPGDRLPSIRLLCRENGISPATALQAYYELERKGLVEARPRSGYYVAVPRRNFLPAPPSSQPVTAIDEALTENLVNRVYTALAQKDRVQFSLGVPADHLLPVRKLNKALTLAMRTLHGSGTPYEAVQGNQRLRKQVARWSFTWDGRLSEDDVVTTAGCLNALAICLLALTRRGDTIVVESPVYFGVLQLAQSLGLRVLELPTNPITGIEVEALEIAFRTRKIAACLLVPNFSNPLGSCMPDAHKKEVVRLAAQFGVPLIEDDLYGDVYFGNHRPKPCKSFDESGIVLWCSSVSKTLAPGYRVGWVVPGRFKEKVLRTKQQHAIATPGLLQETVGIFLETGRYENHLRNLRQQLHANMLHYMNAISQSFPDGTRVSHPQGGFLLWVQLPQGSNTTALFRKAEQHRIGIAPGRMFTLRNQYNDCLRLSYGLGWNSEVAAALHLLGRLAHT